MQQGTALCCTGVKPAAEGVYCKACGFIKDSEQCCAEENEVCTKCGLAKGSPICCKVKSDDDGEKAEGDDDDGEKAEGDDDDDDDK